MRPWLVPFALICACNGASNGDEFSTVRCRAHAFVAERPHSGETPGFTEWTAPASGVTYLVDATAVETSGQPPEDPGVVRRFDAAALAEFERSTDKRDQVVRWASGQLDKRMRNAHRVVLTLKPGAASEVTIVASPKNEMDKRERRHRVLSFSLDGVSPDQEMTLSADLSDVLHGSWGDEQRVEAPIRNIEVAVPRGEAEGVELVELTFLGEDANYLGAAGTQVSEIDGRLMPSWWTRPNAAVRIPVQIEEGAELRWHDGKVGDAGARVITVRPAEGEPVELARATNASGWTHTTADLAPWAGQRVVLELTVEGEQGIGLFGDPRVVVPREDRAPNVLVYLFDTMRADHLGAYGSQAPGVSPVMDRMASEGTQFNAAFSHSPWTKPSIPTLMSGLLPTTHKVGSNAYTDKMPTSVDLIATRMRAAGYRTGSFSASPLGSDLSGLDRDFSMAAPPRAWWGKLGDLRHVSLEQTQQAALEFWAEEPDQPVFLYLHAMEVHGWRRSPYKNPPAGLESYDFTIQDLNTKLGAFVSELREREMMDDTMFVLTSDHGESLTDGDVREHDVKDHGTGLFNSQIQIPLILWGDGIPSQGVSHPVGLADVAPTVLELAHAEPLEDIDGRSLVPYLAGPVAEPLHPDGVLSARIRYIWEPNDPMWFSLVQNDHHKLVRKESEFEYYFDLDEDLCEANQTDADRSDAVATMDRWLEAQKQRHTAFTAEHGSALSGAVDAADVEMLKEMGYIEE